MKRSFSFFILFFLLATSAGAADFVTADADVSKISVVEACANGKGSKPEVKFFLKGQTAPADIDPQRWPGDTAAAQVNDKLDIVSYFPGGVWVTFGHLAENPDAACAKSGAATAEIAVIPMAKLHYRAGSKGCSGGWFAAMDPHYTFFSALTVMAEGKTYVKSSSKDSRWPSMSACREHYAVIEGKTTEAGRLERRVASGDTEAEVQLGYDYLSGAGVPKDPAKAMELWHKAAEKNQVQALLALGDAYGHANPPDYAQAYFWLSLSSNSNTVQNEEYRSHLTPEQAAAIDNRVTDWLRQLAARGDGEAQGKLGELLYAGGAGCPQDCAEAYVWFALRAKDPTYTWYYQPLADTALKEMPDRQREAAQEFVHRWRRGIDLPEGLHSPPRTAATAPSSPLR